MPTSFDNLSNGALADVMGDLDTQIKALQARLKDAKAEMRSRRIKRADSNRYTVTKVSSRKHILDGPAVKEEMGDGWWRDRCKDSTSVSFAIKAKAPTVATAA